jgi:hypothetical protein
MRGFLQPAVLEQPTDSQRAFTALSRSRRMKVARAAHTTLVKAQQWGRGDATSPELSTALEGALRALQSKLTKKK